MKYVIDSDTYGIELNPNPEQGKYGVIIYADYTLFCTVYGSSEKEALSRADDIVNSLKYVEYKTKTC